VVMNKLRLLVVLSVFCIASSAQAAAPLIALSSPTDTPPAPTDTPTPVDTSTPVATPPVATLSAFPTSSLVPVAGTWGGLVTKWTWPPLPTNLVANGSFESGIAPWQVTPAQGGFWTQECTSAQDGACALQLLNGNSAPGGSTYACQGLTKPSPGGWYSLGGYVKASGITIPSFGGGRFHMGDNSPCGGFIPGTATPIIGGAVDSGAQATTPWTLSINAMTFLAAGTYNLVAYAYGKPNGTVQFDNLVVNQLEAPTAEMFLLYPNYMSKLWDDGTQVLKADVRGTGNATADLTNSSGIVLSSTPVVLTSSWQTITIDETSLNLPDGTYFLSLNVPGSNFTPQYRIVKEPRTANGYIDEQGYLHLPNAQGQMTRRFAIGVYDTGAAYGFVPAWSTYLSKFFPAVKADLYLNYFQDGTTQANIVAMGQALRSLGMAGIDTINDRMSVYDWFGIPTSSYLVPRATNDNGKPGLFAWYLADERDVDWSLGRGNPIQGSWGIRTTVRPNAPDMPALIVQNAPNELEPWRDVADIIGIDPYSVFTSNLHGFVQSQTAIAVAQGHKARPTWVVVQFFGDPAGTKWPNRAQLREDTWQAICTGAQGIFFWSLGARGYQWLASDANKASHLADLEAVVNEVKSFEVQLTGTPVAPPAFPAGIIGIARMVGSTTYVFSANTTAAVVSDGARHSWQPYDTQFWNF
jgi:hypothetical protein